MTDIDRIADALVDPLFEMQRGHFIGDTALSNAHGWAGYVAASLVAALSVAPQPVEPATCEHGRTGPHPTNPAGHLSQRTCNCPLCPGPAA